MPWHSLEKLVRPAVTRAGVTQQVDAARICELAENAIQKHCDPTTARNSQVVSYRDRALTISVSGSNYAQDIRLHQRLIQKTLTTEIGEAIVDRIFYRI